MASIRLAGFLKWEAPDGDVLLCDGGKVDFDGDEYTAKPHPLFGSISGFQPISEGVGDESPAGTLTFSPHPDAALEDINTPALQGTRIRMWIGEIDRETGVLDGVPDLMFDSLVDVTRLKLGRGAKQLEVDIVSRAERLFLLNEGNVLSGEAHRRVFADERGLDNALGVPTVVAWGVTGAPRGTVTGGGSSGIGGSFNGPAGEPTY